MLGPQLKVEMTAYSEIGFGVCTHVGLMLGPLCKDIVISTCTCVRGLTRQDLSFVAGVSS